MKRNYQKQLSRELRHGAIKLDLYII